MLRQSQLPPRAPLRSKEIACPIDELSRTNPPPKCDVFTRHKKSLSHSSVLEDQPAWMDDLLSDLNSTPRRSHCRSASDSVAFLDDLVPRSMLLSRNDEENSNSDGSGGGALESACVYGPNSPRRKVNVEFLGNSVLTALSDCASQTQTQFLEEIPFSSWPSHVESWGDGVGSINKMNAEQKLENRHPRQRSRVRKLQYISELERTVNTLEVLESELQYKVSALLQQRLTLSMENSKLKQHMSKLQRKKLVLDSEHQTLRREAERMRLGLAKSSSQPQNKVLLHPRQRSNSVKASEDNWEMLDWAKLNLG